MSKGWGFNVGLGFRVKGYRVNLGMNEVLLGFKGLTREPKPKKKRE